MATAFQKSMEKAAVARATNLPISTKVSYEIANAIKNKPATKVISFLKRVITMDEAVPYKRFNDSVGHRSGTSMASGRYPIKASKAFLSLVESAVSNARDKGLNEEALVVVHVCPNQGSGQWHHGRQRRRKVKATHLEIVVEELPTLVKKAKSKSKSKIAASNSAAKGAVKNTVAKEVSKEEQAVEEKPVESVKKAETVETKPVEKDDKAEPVLKADTTKKVATKDAPAQE